MLLLLLLFLVMRLLTMVLCCSRLCLAQISQLCQAAHELLWHLPVSIINSSSSRHTTAGVLAVASISACLKMHRAIVA
jgi:hypothetical protein